MKNFDQHTASTRRKKYNKSRMSLRHDPAVQTEWLETKDATHAFNVSSKLLRKWRTQGLIYGYKVGRKLFYKLSEINEMLNNHRIAG